MSAILLTVKVKVKGRREEREAGPFLNGKGETTKKREPEEGRKKGRRQPRGLRLWDWLASLRAWVGSFL